MAEISANLSDPLNGAVAPFRVSEPFGGSAFWGESAVLPKSNGRRPGEAGGVPGGVCCIRSSVLPENVFGPFDGDEADKER